jgi:cytochrome bd-type quinol oxidase subunit 2
MIDTSLKLALTWICVMLIYLLGDVLRIYSGDFKDGQMAGVPFDPSQTMWLLIALLMVTPIVMVFLSVSVDQPVSRWANIGVAVFFLLFNLVGLPTYPSLYDKFLLVVSMGFNVITIWYAWNWTG